MIPTLSSEHTALLRALSMGAQSDASRASVRTLLDDPDPSAVLDRLYPAIMQHHVFPSVAAAIANGAGDLAHASVSRRIYDACWPFNGMFPSPATDGSGRISLAAIDRLRNDHARLLDEVATSLPTIIGERVILLFGSALRARVPTYSRLSNDLDLLVPTGRDAVTLADQLGRRGFTIARFRSSNAAGAVVAHFKLIRITDNGHQIHVDVIGGGRPAGPGLRPPWVYPPVFARAEQVEVGGATAWVPSLEDLFLLLAEKTNRKAAFVLRDALDTNLLLGRTDAALDWEYLAAAVRTQRLHWSASRLLSEAEQLAARPLVSDAVREQLRPSPREARVLSRPESPAAQLLMASTYLRASPRLGTVLSFATDRCRAGILKLRLRSARSGMEHGLRRVDPVASVHLIVGGFPNPRHVRPGPGA